MSVSFLMWTAQTFIYIIGRLGVPLFLMLTGALMLGREYESYDKYFKKRVLPIIGISVVWFFIYFIFQSILSHKLTLKIILISLRKSLLLDYFGASHLWYLSMVIGLYLFLPLINQLVKNCKTKDLVIYSVIAILILTIPEMLNKFLILNGRTEDTFKTAQIAQGIPFGIYPLYVIIGYLCYNRNILKKFNTATLCAAFSLSIVLLGLIQYHYYYLLQHKSAEYIGSYLWYNNFFIVISGIALFEILSRIKTENKAAVAVLTALSNDSFGIYLMHMMFVQYFLNWAKALPLTKLGNTAVLFLIAFFGSWLIVWVSSKIPGIKYLFTISPKKAKQNSR